MGARQSCEISLLVIPPSPTESDVDWWSRASNLLARYSPTSVAPEDVRETLLGCKGYTLVVKCNETKIPNPRRIQRACDILEKNPSIAAVTLNVYADDHLTPVPDNVSRSVLPERVGAAIDSLSPPAPGIFATDTMCRSCYVTSAERVRTHETNEWYYID